MRLTDIDAHSAPARAAQILAGLGFDEAAQQRACGDFSGGWRMRVALAAVLFLEPEVLLLDEPTNYLDLEGTLWLETYLRTYPHTVLIVSHDRDLLNRAVAAILHLERGKLTLYSGGYDDFEETRREKQRLELKLKKKQDDERRRIQAFIDRFKAKATKAAQAQSRVKALAKMQPIAAQVEERVVPFHLPQPLKALASPLMRLEDVVGRLRAGPARPAAVSTCASTRTTASRCSARTATASRPSPSCIAGKLAPLSGRVYGAKRVDVGYFAQHQLDELNPQATPYDHMLKLMPEATEAQQRTRLGTFGFCADKADTNCANLSGGEKARLLLALTAFHAPAPADPRRADQPSRRRQPRSAGARADRVRGRRHPHQPRPPSGRGHAPTACGSCATARSRPTTATWTATAPSCSPSAAARPAPVNAARAMPTRERPRRPAPRCRRPARRARAAEEGHAERGEVGRGAQRRRSRSSTGCSPTPRSTRATRRAPRARGSSADNLSSVAARPRRRGSPPAKPTRVRARRTPTQRRRDDACGARETRRRYAHQMCRHTLNSIAMPRHLYHRAPGSWPPG